MVEKSPTSFNNPGRKTLTDADMQGLGDALLALTREVWVLTDRLAAVESVLAERGIDIKDDVDRFVPDADQNAQLQDQGKALVSSILGALARSDAKNDSQ